MKYPLKSVWQSMLQFENQYHEFIQEKRKIFPRFYFLSDSETILLLGGYKSDPIQFGKVAKKNVLGTKLMI